MPKKTTILILLLAVVTAVLVFFAITANDVNQPPQRTETPPENEEESIEMTASIYFNPQNVDLSTSTTSATTVDIVIDTGGQNISGVQTEIQYDPQAITNVRLDPAFGADGFFGSGGILLLNEIDPQSGRLSFASAIGTSQQPLSGTGKIATLYFESAFGTQSTTTVEFLNKTHVSILGSNKTVLKQTSPLNITLPPTQTINQTPQEQQPPIFETLPEEPLVP